MDSKSSLTTLSIFLTKRRILALPALGILAVSAATLSAQTAQTWTAGTGDWTTGSNWSPAGDPNSAAADLYATSGTSVVNLNSSRTAGRVTIGSGDEVNVQNGYYLMLAGSGFSGAGTLVNNGTFRLSGTNSTTAINLGDANNQTITFSGSGDFIMADSTYNYILSGYGGITLVNDTNISGAGNIGNGNILNLVNNGSIRATGTNTLNLYLNGSGTFTNNGTLRAEAGSRLNFLPVGTFNNTGNTVTADGAGAELFIGYSSIFNSGTFAGINGGKTILESASTLNSVSLVGAAEIRNGYYSTIFTGTTTVSGTLAVSGSNSSTGFRLGDANGQTVTLAGAGAVALSDSANNFIGTNYSGITLVNDTNISGAGNIGNGNILNLVNNGSIRATGTNTLNLYLNGSGTFTNNGTLRAEAGSRLNFLPVGTFNNTGNTVTADGAGAELFIGYSSIFNSGTFAGINGGKTILESASTLNSVSLVGAAEIRNGYYSTIFTGTTTVSGTLAVSGSSSTTGMSLGNANGQTVTLAGPGAIELSDSGNNYILTSYGGITLVNETNISGAGNIGNGNIQSVINNGSILAMGTNNLNLYLNGSGTFANNGTLGGQDGQLRVVGNWTFFTNYNNGTQTLTGGTWVATDTGAPGSEEIEFTDPSKQVLINNATISLSGSSAFIRGVSGVTNQNSGTLSISNGQVFTTNTGTMTNTGSLLVTQGAVLNAEYVSTGGSLVMDSGSIDDSAFLSGASIFEGNGTVEGDFTAAGTTNIIPGSGIGTLALQNGNYLQTGGQITLDIARLGGVPTQDAITALNGAVTVSDTTIELNLLAGSQTLHVGDTFTVLQANFLNVGDDLTLTNINYVFGSSLSSYTFSTNVNGDALSFTVLTVPEPSTMVLLGVGLGVLALRSRKRASRA